MAAEASRTRGSASPPGMSAVVQSVSATDIPRPREISEFMRSLPAVLIPISAHLASSSSPRRAPIIYVPTPNSAPRLRGAVFNDNIVDPRGLSFIRKENNNVAVSAVTAHVIVVSLNCVHHFFIKTFYLIPEKINIPFRST